MFGRTLTRAIAFATVATLIIASTAAADTVTNNLDNSVDNTKEALALTAGGSNGSSLIFVRPTNNNLTYPDSSGCNVTAEITITVSAASSDDDVATVALVSPTDDAVAKTVFDGCTDFQGGTTSLTQPGEAIKVLVTPLAAGTADITISGPASTSRGTMHYAPATFTVNVSPPPDSTAPTITPNIVGTQGSNGWYTSDVTLSWTVSDPDSAITSQTGCGTTNITADQPATNYTCSATSAGGTNSVTVSIKRDATAPTVTPASVNNTTWRNSSLSQTFTASDTGSGLNTTGLDASNQFTLTASAESTTTSATTVSQTVFDLAGNNTTRSVTALIDRTDPSISASLSPAAASTGWYNIDTGAPTVSFLCSDTLSGLAGACPASHTFGEGADQSYSRSILDNAGNSNSAGVTNVDVDLQAPDVVYTSAAPAGSGAAPNAAGWYTSAVDATFTATDNISGFGSTGALTTTGVATSVGEGAAVSVDSPAFTDNAGNETAAGAASHSFKIDLSDPTNVAFVGGPAADSSHYFGSVPAAPTCTADDAISGLDSCVVTRYSSAVGTHTMTATATDNAGRTTTATRSYTVLAWTTSGFYSPVDMTTGTTAVINTVKGGSTVPLKFEVFAGPAGVNELTSTSNVRYFTYRQISCGSLGAATADDIEQVTTGGTSLRYDSTGGQFIQNWQLPKTSGICYVATIGLQDGSTISAYFKTK